METLADESLVTVFRSLPGACLVQVSQACRQFLPLARTDLLWLPLAARRWRFGASSTGAHALAPGARDEASASALADATSGPFRAEAGAFSLALRRFQQDYDVAALVVQHSLSIKKLEQEALQLGAVVQIGGLLSAVHRNGEMGVVTAVPKMSEERFAVILMSSLQGLTVRAKNLSVVKPAISSNDAERSVLEIGAEGIDGLVRVSRLATTGSRILASSKYLLAMTAEQWAVKHWKLLVSDEQRADMLEEGALVLSQWYAPASADVAAVRAQLAALADAAEAKVIARTASMRERIEAVNSVLFDSYGLTGNVDNYYDPQNSLIHCVLERRRGIPISLSIVWAALARRVHVPCFLCVNMPQHVLIRVSSGEHIHEDLYVDAFGRRVMDYQGLLEFTRTLGIPGFQDEFVAKRPATAVYSRCLRNLIGIFRNACARAHIDISSLQRLLGACSQAIAVSDESNGREAAALESLRADVLEALKSAQAVALL